MKHIAMVVVCLMLTAGNMVNGGEFDETALKGMIAQLGDDNFRVRRKAQKAIITELAALQKSFMSMLEKAKSKPSDKLKTLTKRLKGLMTIMEAIDKTSEDPEVQMRMKKVLVGAYPSFVYDQKLELQKLIVAEFKDTSIEDRNNGKMVKVNIYSVSNTAVMEICDLRVIRIGDKDSDFGHTSDKMPIDYDGGWSSSGGAFSFKASNHQTICKWKGWNFTINKREFVIGKRNIRIGEGKNVLIVDKDGGFKSHFKLNR